jgi:hypothetical protein
VFSYRQHAGNYASALYNNCDLACISCRPHQGRLRNELIVDLVSVGAVFATLSGTWRSGLGGADVERYLHHYQDELPSGKRLEPPNLLSDRFA